jgi:hypothetical protein
MPIPSRRIDRSINEIHPIELVDEPFSILVAWSGGRCDNVDSWGCVSAVVVAGTRVAIHQLVKPDSLSRRTMHCMRFGSPRSEATVHLRTPRTRVQTHISRIHERTIQWRIMGVRWEGWELVGLQLELCLRTGCVVHCGSGSGCSTWKADEWSRHVELLSFRDVHTVQFSTSK